MMAAVPAGGMLEIFLFVLVAGVTAQLIGASVHEGIFVGALVRGSCTTVCWHLPV